MGKVFSVAARKARRFNVENRAHKVISMDKPTPAPKHPASQKEIDILMKEHEEAFVELKKKNHPLDENLKKVYVTSTNLNMDKFGKPSDKSRLPVNKSGNIDSEFGYEEPEIIPKGKVTLKQAMRILTDRQALPENFTADKIAQTLNIPPDKAVHLVNYFSSLKIYMPESVPQLSSAEKAKRVLIGKISPTKVTTTQGSQSESLHLENTTKSKPG